MLAGWINDKDNDDKKVPIFLPDDCCVLVGRAVFDLLEREHGPVIVVDSGVDAEQELNKTLETQPFALIRMESFDYALAKQIAELVPGHSIFILNPDLESFGHQVLVSSNRSLKTADEAFESFAFDFMGIPMVTKPEPVKRVPVRNKPKAVEPKEAEDLPGFKQDRSPIWPGIKKDILNPLFSLVFIFLGFATELGFFFLGEDSTQVFRVACLIMAGIFPFMACVPMGFLYRDRHCHRPDDSLFFLVSLVVVGLIAFICPILCLAVGNSLGWSSNDLALFSWLGLSSLLWIALRIVFDPLLLCLSKKEA